MYSYDARVGFSMVDAEEKISIPSIINLFQDCSTFHSEDLGIGLHYLQDRHEVWVLNSWQIDILKYPVAMQRLKVCTAPYSMSAFMGLRNFWLEDEAGEILVKANTLWCLLDTDTMHPTNICQEMIEKYVLSEKLDMEYASRKISVPKEGAKEFPALRVESFHLDPNHHMNNGQYVNIAGSFLPENFQIRRLRTEYKKQAFLGDSLYPSVIDGGDGRYIVQLNDAEGKPYFVAEFC